MMPSGHKAFLVNNVNDVNLLMMHNRTFAAEYVDCFGSTRICESRELDKLTCNNRIAHSVSSRKRVDIIERAKQLGVKVTNPRAKVTSEV